MESKIAFTLTPHNKNIYATFNVTSVTDVSLIEQQMRILNFFKDNEYEMNEITFETCHKGQSKGKVHAHGVVTLTPDDLKYFKTDIINQFGHNGSDRCIHLVPLEHPDIWAQYIRKDQNLFL